MSRRPLKHLFRRPLRGISLGIGLLTLLAVGLAYVGSQATGFAQNLLVELAGTALSLAIGLLVVHVYLQLDEKRRAAEPLLKMIAPSIETFHNDYFIEKGRLAFGIPGFNALLEAYQQNKGNPQALTPQQRDGLYDLIQGNHQHVLPLLDSIHDQLKELSLLLGWSFSPLIMRAALDCRLHIVKLRSLRFSDDPQTKLVACELYLDIDGSAGTVLSELASLLGFKDEDWQAER